MLDFLHLGNQIHLGRECVGKSSAGKDKMGVGLSCLLKQNFNIFFLHELFSQGIEYLVGNKDIHLPESAFCPVKGTAGCSPVSGTLFFTSEEAFTGGKEVPAKQVPEKRLLACFPIAFHELNKGNAHSSSVCAHGLPKTGGGFALAVSCIDVNHRVSPFERAE